MHCKKGAPMSEQPSGSPPPPSPLCRKARRRLPFPSCSGNRPSGPPAQSSPVTPWPALLPGPGCLTAAAHLELWPSSWRADSATRCRGEVWSPSRLGLGPQGPFQEQCLGLLCPRSFLHKTGSTSVPAVTYHREDQLCKQR